MSRLEEQCGHSMQSPHNIYFSTRCSVRSTTETQLERVNYEKRKVSWGGYGGSLVLEGGAFIGGWLLSSSENVSVLFVPL